MHAHDDNSQQSETSQAEVAGHRRACCKTWRLQDTPSPTSQACPAEMSGAHGARRNCPLWAQRRGRMLDPNERNENAVSHNAATSQTEPHLPLSRFASEHYRQTPTAPFVQPCTDFVARHVCIDDPLPTDALTNRSKKRVDARQRHMSVQVNRDSDSRAAQGPAVRSPTPHQTSPYRRLRAQTPGASKSPPPERSHPMHTLWLAVRARAPARYLRRHARERIEGRQLACSWAEAIVRDHVC